jgi:hypothetical protein
VGAEAKRSRERVALRRNDRVSGSRRGELIA